MPYMIVNGDEVHKKNADGSAGELVPGGKHKTHEEAVKHLQALEIAMKEEKKSLEGQTFTREMSLQSLPPVSGAQMDDRCVRCSFSSETPVERELFGKSVFEVLDHSPGSADLARLNNGAPLLWQHDPNQMIGKVESAQIDGDKVGRCVVRFGSSARAKEVYQDVKDGIISKASFLYTINGYKEEGDAEKPTLRITKWAANEISLVSVPADDSVGINRSLSVSETPTEGNDGLKEGTHGSTSAEDGVNTQEQRNAEPSHKNVTQSRRNPMGLNVEKERIMKIDALTSKFRHLVTDIDALRNSAVESDMSYEGFAAQVSEKAATKAVELKPASDLGLSNKEVGKYSISRAIMGNLPGSGVDAAYEIELSNQIAKNLVQTGIKTHGGLFIPWEVQTRQFASRANNPYVAGTPIAGGDLVQTTILAANFIELLRHRTISDKVGVEFLTGLQGNIELPKRSAAASVAWGTETATISPTTGSYTQVPLTPHQLRGNYQYSRQLLLQSNPSIDGLVMSDLSKILALEVDRVVFYGSGSSSQPTGIKFTAGVTSGSYSTSSYANAVTIETQVAISDADVATMYWATNAQLYGQWETTAKANIFSSTYPVTQFCLENGKLTGFPVVRSNQLENGDMFFGDFSQATIGNWGVLELLPDYYTGAGNSLVNLWAYLFMDVAIRQTKAFSYAYGVNQ